MSISFQSYLASNPPLMKKIGQWKGCSKIYLTYKNGYRIEKFNIFQLLFKKMGFYPKARLTRVVSYLNSEMYVKNQISPEQLNLIGKIKHCWEKKYGMSFPITNLMIPTASQNSPFKISKASKEICAELDTHSGIIIGERHNERASMKFMIENMAGFKAKGVETIFIELLTQDESSKDCKEYFSKKNSSNKLPEALEERVLFHDLYYYGLIGKELKMDDNDARELVKKYNENVLTDDQLQHIEELIRQEQEHPYNLEKLFKSAKQHGIKIVPMDILAAKNQASFAERVKKMNKAAAKTVRKHQLNHDGKYIICCGQSHAVQFEKVKGLNRRLGVPNVFLKEKLKTKSEFFKKSLEIKFDETPFAIFDNPNYELSLVCTPGSLIS